MPLSIDPALLTRLTAIPAMSPPDLLEDLYQIGRRYRGEGVFVECGSWLGATCASLAAGLREASYERPIYCYDRWQADAVEEALAAERGLAIRDGDDLEPHFRRFVEPFCPRLETTKGRIQDATWHGDPIEFFLLDTAKKEPNFSHVLRIFGPSWIPGITIVGLLDLHYYLSRDRDDPKRERFRCQQRFINRYADHFELLVERRHSIFFRYTREIPWREVRPPGLRTRIAALFASS